MTGLSRRTLLRTGALLSVGAAASISHPAVAGAQDDFATMRQQWRALHVADGYDPQRPDIAELLRGLTETAQGHWSSMATAAGRTCLWEDSQLDLHQSFAISRSFDRLYRMALAYSSPGAGLAGNADLLADIVSGLDWMVANYYREDGEQIGNWFEWMIAGPASFNNAAMLIFDQLSAEQIGAYTRATAHYTPEPIATAANRALTANVVVGRGALASDAATVKLGVDGLTPVLAYVTSGDGFYADGSFIQHEFYPYLGGYGVSIPDTLAPIINIVTGTPWELTAFR
jgi:hyaluronate lyase